MSTKDMYEDDYSNFIHNCQKLEKSPRFITAMDTQIVILTHSGMLLSHEK